jgi:uncharacterized protein
MKRTLTSIMSQLAFVSLLLIIGFTIISATKVQAQVNISDISLVRAVQEAAQYGINYLKAKVSIDGLQLSTEIPTTRELMATGLAVKNELREDESMLFVFEEPLRHSFWMKDMRFPIDIIWIDSNGRVVHIEQNLQPCPLVLICPGYAPTMDSQYVLETVAGFAQRHNIGLGADIKVDLMG